MLFKKNRTRNKLYYDDGSFTFAFLSFIAIGLALLIVWLM